MVDATWQLKKMNRKWRKYSTISELHHFIPVAVEMLGQIFDEGAIFISAIAEEYQKSPMTSSPARKDFPYPENLCGNTTWQLPQYIYLLNIIFSCHLQQCDQWPNFTKDIVFAATAPPPLHHFLFIKPTILTWQSIDQSCFSSIIHKCFLLILNFSWPILKFSDFLENFGLGNSKNLFGVKIKVQNFE